MATGFRTVVIRSSAKLDYQFGRLRVRTAEESIDVFLDEISVLIVESPAVNLTAYLLVELVKRNIKVVFCDHQHNPVSELVNTVGSYDSSKKIRQQMQWTEENKGIIWQHIVRMKLDVQGQLLEHLGFASEAKQLKLYADQVEIGDPLNREGTAAKVYFRRLFGRNFVRFQNNPVNSLLNYGYAIIASLVSREVVACGYLTQLGVGHVGEQNSFNLSYDLLEPLRPVIDRLVLNLEEQQLTPRTKTLLIDSVNSRLLIGGVEQTVLNAARIYVKQALDSVIDGDITRIQRIELSK